jgi:hypothetical protein
MPWPRNQPDPLEIRRRELAEQQRLLVEKMSRLNEELHQGPKPAVTEPKQPEPPVWRMEEDSPRPHFVEPASARPRDLARQRQRDRFVFMICMVLLLLVICVVIWVWKTRALTAD